MAEIQRRSLYSHMANYPDNIKEWAWKVHIVVR